MPVPDPHRPPELAIPADLTPPSLPAYSPELNAIERVWLILRERSLSPRLWPARDDILDACRAAWNALAPETGRIRSLVRSTRPHRSVLNGGGIS